ncbi:hypothetical protein TSTA_050990 [Talaromyces stipitatus ATCC 10500]|uniref:Uncharacterized protein n=1 Tax=Talaromyces stipitatus (strain ATCC 10500 / CBS 375.48 / QM 6759 / NRRL 1006) TaxID=441959 RepID=B8MIZ9_TALSN|nr:uncharacterized protein TSTA_050990 [Talaromyces stipitatus ATCC 10500]EED15661.1 hypothetical protein TSTA_050990 [Talaromyces stipitatus ATCC 10500]
MSIPPDFAPGIADPIEITISNINRLEDITPELIHSVRCGIARPLAIPRFPVTLDEYLEWEARQSQENLQGFDFDPRQERFVLRPRLMLPARGGMRGIVLWLRTALEHLGDNLKGWSLVQNKPYMLTGNYEGIVKRPQTALIKANKSWPSVVVYAETNEAETEVLNNVKQWLYGSNGEVQLVIVIITQEPDIPPLEGSWLEGLDFRLWHNPYQLAEHIYNIEKNKERPTIVGQITSTVWLLARKNCHEDAERLPSSPFYTFKCDLSQALYQGSASNTFTGVPYVDTHHYFHLENVAVPFPFHTYNDSIKRSVMQSIQDRAKTIAIEVWNDRQFVIWQEKLIKAGFGPQDLWETPEDRQYMLECMFLRF